MRLQPLVQKEHRYRRELVTCSRVKRGLVPRGCLKEVRVTWEHLPCKLPSSSPSTCGPGSASCRGSSRGAAEDYMEVLEHSLGNPCVGGEDERGKKDLCD